MLHFLKELRISKGLTRSELAKQFGVSERTVARWENGETDMYQSTAVKLAEFYDVSMDIFK
ncbi:helix-turn-helix transcriptional regulator [Streptococcus sp. HSISS2]|uniref:helix-turn-helix domain-containing protein n=1 Tax=Streptococcus sp. HSISS2 TaxID=1316411 RepID=UPI00107172D4